jgi:hypothetical protein
MNYQQRASIHRSAFRVYSFFPILSILPIHVYFPCSGINMA